MSVIECASRVVERAAASRVEPSATDSRLRRSRAVARRDGYGLRAFPIVVQPPSVEQLALLPA